MKGNIRKGSRDSKTGSIVEEVKIGGINNRVLRYMIMFFNVY